MYMYLRARLVQLQCRICLTISLALDPLCRLEFSLNGEVKKLPWLKITAISFFVDPSKLLLLSGNHEVHCLPLDLPVAKFLQLHTVYLHKH